MADHWIPGSSRQLEQKNSTLADQWSIKIVLWQTTGAEQLALADHLSKIIGSSRPLEQNDCLLQTTGAKTLALADHWSIIIGSSRHLQLDHDPRSSRPTP